MKANELRPATLFALHWYTPPLWPILSKTDSSDLLPLVMMNTPTSPSTSSTTLYNHVRRGVGVPLKSHDKFTLDPGNNLIITNLSDTILGTADTKTIMYYININN